MTKIRETGNSSQIEDRRGSGGGSSGGGLGGLGNILGGRGGGGIPLPGKLGGGAVGIIIALAVLLLPKLLGGVSTSSGVNPSQIATSANGGNDSSAAASDGVCNAELESIICGATEDVQAFWGREFAARGETYEITKTVFFSGSTQTGCGEASSSTGPFYCPNDHLAYFDLDFLQQLQDQFGAQGDLADAYIVAHEYGHHIQNLLGINAKVQQAEQNDSGNANKYSVALELQADCFAGVWANDARARNQFESDSEIDEALNAAAAVGDDRIQQKTQGRVDPETFTHGTSEQRVSWFKKGYTTGDRNQCNTFAEITGDSNITGG